MTSSLMGIVLNVLASLGLVVMSGLFSGLTLGLMSLDIVGLQILAESGHPEDRKRAKLLIPIRKHGNLLLCSLLIGNTITNALLAIFLAGITSGILGLALSSGLIVIFGEIMPQAICSRYGLVVGAKTIFFTRILIVLLFVLAYPISKILDLVLGKEMGTLYNRDELKTLIALHVENPDARLHSGLTHEDSHIMTAVLDYQDRRVQDVMTKLSHVYMIDCNTTLTFNIMLEIHKSGYTRIPVYDGTQNNIIGILYSKDLILIDPNDEVEVKSVLAFHGLGHVRPVSEDATLREMLVEFKKSCSHMMIVVSSKKDCSVVTGVITLEDVIEEVINDEIVDESDRYMNNTQLQIAPNYSCRPNIAEFLKLFNHKMKQHQKLSSGETIAVCTYLKAVHPEFAKFHDHVLHELVQKSEILDVKMSEETAEWKASGPGKYISDQMDFCQTIYRQGEPNSKFSLVLQGQVQVEIGTEKFVSKLGPWRYLGTLALTTMKYIPDFDAYAAAGSRILQIQRQDYFQALERNKNEESLVLDLAYE